MTYLDTAHTCANGQSEERIGRLMTTRRQEVVLATKIPGRTAESIDAKRQTAMLDLLRDHADV